MTVTKLGVVMMMVGTMLGTACAAAPAGEATPDAVDDDTIGPSAWVYSTNTDGTFGANAAIPTQNQYGQVKASATFTGPTTRKMGVCGLMMWKQYGAPVACAGGTQTQVNTQCAGAPVGTGGARYCTQADGSGSGQKYCFYRPGAPTTYCAGSPALSGQPKVAPGSYATSWLFTEANQEWLSYACFEGCTASDPSSSSTMYSEFNWGWCEAHGWPWPCPAAP